MHIYVYITLSPLMPKSIHDILFSDVDMSQLTLLENLNVYLICMYKICLKILHFICGNY